MALLIWNAFDPYLDVILDFFNGHVLSRFGARNLKLVFDELDIFWLRNGNSKTYSESQIRLIISMFLKATEDNNLSRKELLYLVAYIQRKWSPDTALAKNFTMVDEIVEAQVAATVDLAVELYEKTQQEKPLPPEEFVLKTAEIIHHEPDGSEAQALLGGMMQIKNKLIY